MQGCPSKERREHIFDFHFFYNNLSHLHGKIKDQIKNLNLVKSKAETAGYSLSMSMNVLDGTNKMTFTFNVDDYHQLLDNYELMDALLSYVESLRFDGRLCNADRGPKGRQLR